MKLATFTQLDGCEERSFALNGRRAWALERLIEAGATGCTPIIQPAPRWASYVHELRRMGIVIETIREPHGGPYPGTHARYVLRSIVMKGGEA